MNVGFIGNGRMCQAFSAYLAAHDVGIAGIFGKNELYTDYARGEVNVKGLVQLAQRCDILFITTPDDIIAEISEIIAASGAQLSGRIVAHMSGSLPAAVMAPLKDICGGLYSLHPMTSVTGEPLDFSKVRHTLEGAGKQEQTMLGLLSRAGIRYTRLSAENKPLYHAASCFCANYTVTLMDMAQKIYHDIGFDDETVRELIIPIMGQVLSNVAQKGTAKALTGPVSRGDTGTIKKHLAALEQYGKFEDVYRLMGAYTAKLSANAKNITPQTAEKLKALMLSGAEPQ